jgi:exocyst complex component 2
VIRSVDRTLFEDYIKPKATVLTSLMRKGVIDSGVDWYDIPRPTGTSNGDSSPNDN